VSGIHIEENEPHSLERKVDGIGNNVESLQKFQWFSQGAVAVVLAVGIYFWNIQSDTIRKIDERMGKIESNAQSNVKDEIKTQLKVDGNQDSINNLTKDIQQIKADIVKDESRLYEVEQALIRFNSKIK